MAKKSVVSVAEDLYETQLSVINNKLKVKYEDLRKIEPLTENQSKFFELYDKSQIILLHGVAGTGKTYIALYKALEEILSKKTHLRKITLVRSAVPSREIGHLPGGEKEKTEVYTHPYRDICDDVFNKRGLYERLEEQGMLSFMITSFIRGITLDNSVIIVDECQNMTDMELNSIITRVGHRSKIIFCGDFRQTDLYKKNDLSGLKKFMIVADMMPSAKVLEFESDDIVRSDIVKEYIMARINYEEQYATWN